jgi:hypothetical protein
MVDKKHSVNSRKWGNPRRKNITRNPTSQGSTIAQNKSDLGRSG